MIRNIALAAALVIGTTSVALSSEADPNLLNRYPAFNMTKGQALQTSNVALGGHTWSHQSFDRAGATAGF